MGTDDSDPVAAEGEGLDLYDIATWERRSILDTAAAWTYWLGVRAGKLAVIMLALLIFVGLGSVSVLTDEAIGVLTLLSVLPALALAAFVWYADVTTSEPGILLAATFLLSVLTAGFAAVVNGVLRPFFGPLGFVGLLLFFYLVVGPIEETVKLLAVRLYAFNDDRFDAVIDGAVYGAVAGLGFATIENAIYINRALQDVANLTIGLGLIGAGGDITATRALAGPGHVVYSAFAGYYLGLAKFNSANSGPIVVKGLLIAAAIHATYNATVGIASQLIQAVTGLSELVAAFLYILAYVSLFGYLLYRKLARYRDAYRATHDNDVESPHGAETSTGLN